MQQWPLSGTELETGMLQFGASNIFYEVYKDELIAAKNVTLYIYASATELITRGNSETVNRVRLVQSDGKKFLISAKVFILATGGFENARLLLMSD